MENHNQTTHYFIPLHIFFLCNSYTFFFNPLTPFCLFVILILTSYLKFPVVSILFLCCNHPEKQKNCYSTPESFSISLILSRTHSQFCLHLEWNWLILLTCWSVVFLTSVFAVWLMHAGLASGQSSSMFSLISLKRKKKPPKKQKSVNNLHIGLKPVQYALSSLCDVSLLLRFSLSKCSVLTAIGNH